MSMQLYDLARMYQDETTAYAEAWRSAHGRWTSAVRSTGRLAAFRTRAARALVLAGARLSADHGDRALLRAVVTATNGTTTRRG